MIAIGANEELPTENYLHLMSYNVRLFDVYNPKLSNAIKTRNKIFKYIKEENAKEISKLGKLNLVQRDSVWSSFEAP
jgi:hypothetical protein